MPRCTIGKQPKSNLDMAYDDLVFDEGFRSEPYWDPIGKTSTAGYGFIEKQHQHHWDKADAQKVLKQYIADKDRIARQNKYWGQQYQQMSPQMQAQIINLMFQGGDYVIDTKMPAFRKALMKGDWNAAADQLNFGMKQTTSRSKRRQDKFRSGISDMLDRTQTYDPVITQPMIQNAVESNPTNSYSYSEPVKNMMSNVDANLFQPVEIPYYTPGPIHMPNLTLPDIRSLLEKSIFKPTWTAQ